MLPLFISYCFEMVNGRTTRVQRILMLLQVNGRPVLGSLEMGEGPAPSGLISGQPRCVCVQYLHLASRQENVNLSELSCWV